MARCKDCVVGILGACGVDYCRTERELLVDQARQLAEHRGHSLSGFIKEKNRPVWRASCIRCGLQAGINLDPSTDERDVFGEAVTAQCQEVEGVSERSLDYEGKDDRI